MKVLGIRKVQEEPGVMTIHPELFQYWCQKIDNMPDFDWLFKYQKQDLARAVMKPFDIVGYLQGLGKTPLAYAMGKLLEAKRVLVFTFSSLIDTWVEIANMKEWGSGKPVIRVLTGNEDYRDLVAGNDSVFYIASYEMLARYTAIYAPMTCKKCGENFAAKQCTRCGWKPFKKDIKVKKSKPFYKTLNKINWPIVFLDEAQAIKSKTSLRSRAMFSIKAKRKYMLTGTPMKGWVTDIAVPLAYLAAGGSPYFPYNIFEGGTRDFLNDFAVYEYSSDRWKDTLSEGRKKMVPGIKNVSLWYKIIGPLLIRRHTEHEAVKEEVKLPPVEIKKIRVRMDPAHKEFYDWWLNEFSTWFHAKLEEEERTHDRSMTGMEILSQLWKLRFAATIPTSGKVNNPMIRYPAYSTEKDKVVLNLVSDIVERKEQVIIFTGLNDMATHLKDLLDEAGYRFEVVTGSVSMGKRTKIRKALKKGELDGVISGLLAWGKGVTLTSANNVIITDLDWTPDTIEQAWKRVHRISQLLNVTVWMVLSEGTIDIDIDDLLYDKADAIAIAIDRTRFKDNSKDVGEEDIQRTTAKGFSPRQFAEDLLKRRDLLKAS